MTTFLSKEEKDNILKIVCRDMFLCSLDGFPCGDIEMTDHTIKISLVSNNRGYVRVPQLLLDEVIPSKVTEELDSLSGMAEGKTMKPLSWKCKLKGQYYTIYAVIKTKDFQ